MIHCSGGAQTKVLHFLNEGCKVIKDNLFPTAELFEMIQQQSKTDWKEMYKVFNMGHRMEIYTDEDTAKEIIKISQAFGVEAQIVGRVEEGEKSVEIHSPYGLFTY